MTDPGYPVRPDRALTPAVVVDRALALLGNGERDGTLTVRRLGAELGVDPTAFYRHFRDKDDLMAACLDRLEQVLVDRVLARGGRSGWQDVLRAVADEGWQLACTYPAIFSSAFARLTGGTGEARLVELVLGTVAGLGLDRETSVLLYRSYAACLLGLTGGRAGAIQLRAGTHDQDAWATAHAGLPAAEFPALHRHAAQLAAVTDRQVFDQVVELLLDSLARAAAAAAGGPAT